MAFHTKLSKIEVESILLKYQLGSYVNHMGINQGIENSNYLLHTNKLKYILTIFEKRVNNNDLPFFLELMDHTRASGIVCPTSLKNKNGKRFDTIKNKSFAIFTFIEGKSLKNWSHENCFLIGKKICDFHIANKNFKPRRKNNFGINQFSNLFSKIEKDIEKVLPGAKNLIKKEINFLEKRYPNNLPSGIIHADFFPDNVLFIGKKISGIIDFYFSCFDNFIYDLSIVVNAWCFPNNKFKIENYNSIIEGYQERKNMTDKEFSFLNICLRAAAMRFLLTRLSDRIFPTSDFAQKKSPREFFDILNFHRSHDITTKG